MLRSAMPMLADLDDPPRSRLPGLLAGSLIGLPAVGLLAWLILPPLMGSILGGAESFDQRLRREDTYMQAICTEGLDVERDKELCGCVWAVEYPSLDCRHRFLRWSLDRHVTSCGDEATRKQALSFCACVDVISESVVKAEAALATYESLAPAEILKLENCIALDDALELPSLESLGVASAPE